MAKASASEMIFVTLNHNVTLLGKAWLIVLVFLRILVLLFAGYPLYQDEQERFVCNTIQPGCANVCYDMFAPLSLFRFWVVQLSTLCLPYVTFVIYVIHKLHSGLVPNSGEPESIKADSIYKINGESFRKASLCETTVKAEKGRVPCFTGAYIFNLLCRMLAEAAFGAAHYYLFSFRIPKRFMCQQTPCTTVVDCYISRPTEKTIMLNFMFGIAALSLLLNAFDFIWAVKRSMVQKGKRKMLVEKMYAEEQYYLSGNGGHVDAALPPQDVLVSGGFQKSRTRDSSGEEGASVVLSDDLTKASPLGGTSDDKGIYQPTQENRMVREGSEVALYPNDPSGTPRSIRVSKRSRLKPPPPPRKDKLTSPGPLEVPGAMCTRRVGQYTLVQLTASEEAPAGDGQEKRSEWV